VTQTGIQGGLWTE